MKLSICFICLIFKNKLLYIKNDKKYTQWYPDPTVRYNILDPFKMSNKIAGYKYRPFFEVYIINKTIWRYNIVGASLVDYLV